MPTSRTAPAVDDQAYPACPACPDEGGEGGDDDHGSTTGTYVINAVYIAVFFIGYLYVFYELSHRWPVR